MAAALANAVAKAHECKQLFEACDVARGALRRAGVAVNDVAPLSLLSIHRRSHSRDPELMSDSSSCLSSIEPPSPVSPKYKAGSRRSKDAPPLTLEKLPKVSEKFAE